MAFSSHSTPPRSPSQASTGPARVARFKDSFTAATRDLMLTPSQGRFAEAFFTGANVCLSGAAGYGKSFIIKTLFDALPGVSISRCASTGVAAFALGGQTIHSWAGLGLADEHLESIIEKVKKNSKAKARMRAAEVLLIDEVSMLKGDLIDKLDGVLKWARSSGAPFGGIQVVACCDWLQLLPVFKGDERAQLAFQSRAWREASFKTIVLKEPVRQAEGSVLLKVLTDLRVGDTNSLHLLQSRVDAVFPASDVEPVRIFCRNVDVSQFNEERLAKLATPPRLYHAQDSGSPYHVEAFNKNCPAPETLTLKVGAQVMLTANVSVLDGHVNGAIGVVKAFGPSAVTVRFKGGKSLLVERSEWTIKEQEAGVDGKIRYRVVATRSQIPLRLCYAVTVHKVQGQTLDCAVIDVQEAFGAGMIYVALSRVRDLESLSLVGGVTPSAVKVDPHCVQFYREAEQEDDSGL